MRHNRDEKRFSRSSAHLKAMLANMTNDLVISGRIKTTTPKAKLLRRYAERMVTLGKDGSLSARRRAMAFMRNKGAVTKLFGEVAERYSQRNGGYTRVLKIGLRHGDCAPMSLIEFVEDKEAPTEKPKSAKKLVTRAKNIASKAKQAAKAKTPAKPKEGSKTAKK
jgi:large subunit ribosomal protein L17